MSGDLCTRRETNAAKPGGVGLVGEAPVYQILRSPRSDRRWSRRPEAVPA
jgi:hypothetical protein